MSKANNIPRTPKYPKSWNRRSFVKNLINKAPYPINENRIKK